jgi:hypothetical protein
MVAFIGSFHEHPFTCITEFEAELMTYSYSSSQVVRANIVADPTIAHLVSDPGVRPNRRNLPVSEVHLRDKQQLPKGTTRFRNLVE